ncbi:hypothetical protein CYMTET_5164 [Cymbomonas tetramitiformis]|uniref:Uncharacterized protein n=1 Tax=Cymbomonas tetramitiformis TaxID=36881 RepID=A0AAE0GZN8_9CHLO|nr:hypothetical protein CYMTET_5164 [Cymbomonas tetramitiformis]
MKGTKDKQDLLVVKPQTPDQDGITYVKLCMRREAALNAGKMVADSMARQNIEDCIKLLLIREYKERVSEQLRVQFPAPTKVTWKDLEVIVEVQDKLKNDAESLTLQQELTRRAQGLLEEGTSCTCWDAYVPQDFHKRRLQSIHEHETARQADGGDGAGAQALSVDELEYDSNCNERDEYVAVDRIGSAEAEEVINDHSEVDQAAAEVNEHQVYEPPETVLPKAGDVTTRCDGHQTDIQELPLDEMPDGVVDLVTARWAAAACVDDHGVVDFSEHGHVRAGTIQNRPYEASRLKMKDHLTEDQTLQMAQGQSICKLLNATLYEGLALVSSGGELMFYRALLMDTGANCNIIAIAVDNSWDLLVDTGPLKNSLMIDIKLGRGVAVSYAPSVLGMDTQDEEQRVAASGERPEYTVDDMLVPSSPLSGS